MTSDHAAFKSYEVMAPSEPQGERRLVENLARAISRYVRQEFDQQPGRYERQDIDQVR